MCILAKLKKSIFLATHYVYNLILKDEILYKHTSPTPFIAAGI